MAFIKFKPIASYFTFYEKANIKYVKDITSFLMENENVMYAYKSKRDLVCFTDKRILLVDKKGIRGFRKSIYGILYSSISSYVLSVKNFDSKLEIVMDSSHKVMINFSKPIPLEEVYDIYKFLANKVTK